MNNNQLKKQRERSRHWRERYPELAKERTRIAQRKKYLESPEIYLKKQKHFREARRKKTIEMYGGKCACCGETEIKFLCLDHINGGGIKERKRFNSTSTYYSFLRKKKNKNIQVLCHNCNMAKGFYGKCPHKK